MVSSGKYMPKVWKKREKTHATTQAVGWKPCPCPMEGARAWPVCLSGIVSQGHDSLSPANPEAQRRLGHCWVTEELGSNKAACAACAHCRTHMERHSQGGLGQNLKGETNSCRNQRELPLLPHALLCA